MKKLTGLFFVAILCMANVQAQSAVDIMQKSLTAMGNAKSMTYHFYAQERMHDGKYSKSDVEFKVIASPLKVYANAKLPQAAQLRFEPAKSAVKKILETSMNARKGENYADFVKLIGTVSYDNKDCWKVELSDPDYKIVNYTVAAGETTVWQIGKKLAISEYKIKELNNIDDEVKPGQVIKIPSAYAKKSTFYIDKSTSLPIYHKMEDEKGIYEIYEFKELKLGVTLTDADFEFN